jgi:hypothetical protein
VYFFPGLEIDKRLSVLRLIDAGEGIGKERFIAVAEGSELAGQV